MAPDPYVVTPRVLSPPFTEPPFLTDKSRIFFLPLAAFFFFAMSVLLGWPPHCATRG